MPVHADLPSGRGDKGHGGWEGNQLNKSKEILAFELTKMVHGEEDARQALEAARSLFGSGEDSEHMPSTPVMLEDGKIGVIELLKATGLSASNAEARRLIQQRGIVVEGEKITDISAELTSKDFEKGFVVIKKGKKVFHKAYLG